MTYPIMHKSSVIKCSSGIKWLSEFHYYILAKKIKSFIFHASLHVNANFIHL